MEEDRRQRARSAEKENRTKYFSAPLCLCLACKTGHLVYTGTPVWSQSELIGQRSRIIGKSEVCTCDYCGATHVPTAPMIAKLVEAHIARVEAEVDAEFDAKEKAEVENDPI